MEKWRERLLECLDKDPRSSRAISISSGLGQNAVTQFRTTDKTPSVETVMKIARTIGVSHSYIFTGVELDQDVEDLLRLLKALKPEERHTMIELARHLLERN